MTCPQKRQFKSKEQAEHHAKINHRKYATPFKIYQCELCGKWHLATLKWWNK
jgi:hypothetical protein